MDIANGDIVNIGDGEAVEETVFFDNAAYIASQGFILIVCNMADGFFQCNDNGGLYIFVICPNNPAGYGRVLFLAADVDPECIEFQLVGQF